MTWTEDIAEANLGGSGGMPHYTSQQETERTWHAAIAERGFGEMVFVVSLPVTPASMFDICLTLWEGNTLIGLGTRNSRDGSSCFRQTTRDLAIHDGWTIVSFSGSCNPG